MTFRAPLISNAGTRAPVTELLTWSRGLPPGVIANPVPPIRNYDWPNPLPLKTDAGINRTWIHVQQLIPPVVNPFAQRDWPNPTLALVPGTELKTWTHSLPPGVIGNPVPLIAQTDWPNPQPQKPNLELRTWAQELPPGVMATTLPPRNQDFQNPQPQRQNLELRFWWNPAIQPVAMPFNQDDWPNPAPQRLNLELRTWWQSPAVPPFVQSPFNQSDWPNPLPQAPNLELRTWFNGLPTGQINQALPPNAQYDWPNPPPLPPNLELKSWIQTYSDQAPTPPPQPVVVTVDTHDPGLRKRKRFDDSAQTQVIRESQLKPKRPKAPKPEEAQQPIADPPSDEEDLALLMSDEDEQLTDLIELAAQILRTLH